VKLDTAKIDQITGLKGKLSEPEGVYKVSSPRSARTPTAATETVALPKTYHRAQECNGNSVHKSKTAQKLGCCPRTNAKVPGLEASRNFGKVVFK
jgi:hypothetical protein